MRFPQLPTRLQGWDLNPRPPGYEPDELPDCSTLRQDKNPMGEEGLEPSRSLYGLWILSPVCLPNSTTRPPVRDSLDFLYYNLCDSHLSSLF